MKTTPNGLFETHIHKDTLASTNDYAKTIANENRNVIITADIQTAGKGRNGRVWVSGANGLWATFLLCKELTPNQLHPYNIIIAVSLLQAVRKYYKDALIKWPNDIWIGNKKLAGILIETIVRGGLIQALIIGIGINIKKVPDNSLADIATSFEEVGKNPGKQEFLNELTGQLEKNILETDYKDIFNYWKENNLVLNREITYNEGKGMVTGFDESGNLIVSAGPGKEDTVLFGDVIIISG